MVGAEVYVQRFIRGFLPSYEGFFFGAMVSKRFVVLVQISATRLMFVYTKDMSAWRFFFPKTPFKIHVSAIDKRPENHLTDFLATFLSKTRLSTSGDPNVS